ncbi:hypothetical protein PANA5342_3747 [Pantoea ananatis LMG 5342]|nr:hypothetical protein PANA5342_3747 [Pantoea ananatis LMG 5342]
MRHPAFQLAANETFNLNSGKPLPGDEHLLARRDLFLEGQSTGLPS